jgi:hypothetical protein
MNFDDRTQDVSFSADKGSKHLGVRHNEQRRLGRRPSSRPRRIKASVNRHRTGPSLNTAPQKQTCVDTILPLPSPLKTGEIDQARNDSGDN